MPESTEAALEAYRVIANGLLSAVTLADVAAELGNPERVAYHILGALQDLAPELAVLASLSPPL